MVRTPDNDWPSSNASNAAGQFQRTQSEPGLLTAYVAHNADPRQQAFNKLIGLRKKIENILDNVAVTLQGRPSSSSKSDDCIVYPDFFDKGHTEEFQLADTMLIVGIKFTPIGVLKLTIRPKQVEQVEQVDPAKPQNGNTSASAFFGDRIVGISTEPRQGYRYGSEELAYIKGNEELMYSLGMPIAMFAGNNRLSFYAQGMLSDRLTYIFIDQDEHNDE